MVDVRVSVKGRTDGGLSKGSLTFVRDTDKQTLMAQVVFPGLEEGTPIEMQALDFLKVVKSLFPEITKLEPKNLPEPDPVVRTPGIPDLTGLGLPTLPALVPQGPVSVPGGQAGPSSSSAPRETSGSSGPVTPGGVSPG